MAQSAETIEYLSCVLWNLNSVQTNNICQSEFFELELFDDLTLCK